MSIYEIIQCVFRGSLIFLSCHAELLSRGSHTLVITEFVRDNNPWEGPVHTMEVLVNCTSDNIDVLRISMASKHVADLIPPHTYSDIYIMYVSDPLAEILKNQLGSSMKKIHVVSGPPVWKLEDL